MTRLKHLLIGRNPKRTLVRAILLAGCAYVVFGHLIRPVRVQGISMQPTLTNGSIHFINLIAYRKHEPARGDMVAVAMPGGRAYYLKRVLGMPGETVTFVDGQLLINDVVQDEPYLLGPRGWWNMPPGEVPEGSYFIAGDNRATSFEGHTLGFVARERIVGNLFNLKTEVDRFLRCCIICSFNGQHGGCPSRDRHTFVLSGGASSVLPQCAE